MSYEKARFIMKIFFFFDFFIIFFFLISYTLIFLKTNKDINIILLVVRIQSNYIIIHILFIVVFHLIFYLKNYKS